MLKWVTRILAIMLFVLPAQAQEELQIRDIEKGTGEEANVGETVVVHYTGWLMDGTKFDSSVDRGTPFSFTLGERRVIPGWEKGVEGMQVGGKRELIIPPDMAYGSQGAGGIIPPDATLKFEIELLEVKAKKFSDIDNGTLKAKLASGTTVIDIRRPDEWKQTGVIPGSHLVTFFNNSGQVNPAFGSELQKLISGPSDEVVLICQTGQRSQALSEYLAGQAGFTNVINVEKGIAHWIEDGGEVTQAALPENCWLC
ncbi:MULTISPECIES: FKBP-type peptidyl-prolyl cis-trans isomerase [Stappiaceae]|uniref:FKBP-type peptidyl-prolyl cis-trans isomerase n=1 Tax=Stappiaceae TaxID=2821832 RepID=UPI0003B82D9E|nr:MULTISPECIES: FKBP-type peptidyl-prolyl cis-trans isomerase [Stappiaceae]ERP85817.1 peptidylprolyl isomerase [Labrenzia sp. C1B10]ERS07333.1 peptidylprolyl isomerase [Labrenzia sp. C1B70]UES40753.1 peptidylprolyl isomerase [Roseibium aggregatum]